MNGDCGQTLQSSSGGTAGLGRTHSRGKLDRNVIRSYCARDIAEEVREIGLVHENGEVNRKALAALLGVSKQSVQRWLSAGGPTIREADMALLQRLTARLRLDLHAGIVTEPITARVCMHYHVFHADRLRYEIVRDHTGQKRHYHFRAREHAVDRLPDGSGYCAAGDNLMKRAERRMIKEFRQSDVPKGVKAIAEKAIRDRFSKGLTGIGPDDNDTTVSVAGNM